MRSVLLGLCLAAGLAGTANAAIFGLKAGESLEAIPSAAPTGGDEPFEFTIVPPEPDAEFASYKALVYPKVGLCTVSAYLSPTAGTGLAGAKDAMAKQAALAAKLDAAYGAAVDEEYGDGVGPTEKDLADGVVTVIRAYDRDDHKIPREFDRVALFMQSENGVPQVFVSYDFPDQDACLNARNAAIDAAAPAQ